MFSNVEDVEVWKAKWVTAAEFYSSVIPSYVPIKHTPWAVCLLIVLWKKLALFYELRFGRISLNISLSDSVLETEILQAKVLNSTAELPHFVNYCGLWTLSMVRYFWQLESCSANQIIWTILTRTLISLL